MTASSLRWARTCVRQQARPGGASLAHCSDHLEIHARTREVVRILFVLDASDREIIAWSAVAQVGISGEMIATIQPESGRPTRLAQIPRQPSSPRQTARWIVRAIRAAEVVSGWAVGSASPFQAKASASAALRFATNAVSASEMAGSSAGAS
ncbi:hypothetical protein J3367_20210 [Aurantimonas sp. NFXS3]